MLWISSSAQMLTSLENNTSFFSEHTELITRLSMGVKQFPCFIFSLAVTYHWGCFVWWLLLPCLVKLFKYTHTIFTYLCGFLQTERKKGAKERELILTQQNQIINITWYHLEEPSKICVSVRSVLFHSPPVNPIFLALESSTHRGSNDQHLSVS